MENLQSTQQYVNIIYYNDDHFKTPPCTNEIKTVLNLTYTTPSTWRELVDELEAGAKFLMFHADMACRSMYANPAEFVEAISTIIKFIPASKNLTIGVIVTPTTPLDIIRSLQRAGIQGLILDLNYYSIEETIPSANAFINHIPYWPKHILDSLPVDHIGTTKRPLSLYFRHNYTPRLAPVDRDTFESEIQMDIIYCSNWTDLSSAMARHPHQIIVHFDTIRTLNVTVPEVVTMLETESKIRGISARIGVGIDRTTTLETIKELKRAGIHGIVPSVSNWGIHECVAAMHALRDGQSYWPKHIISTLTIPSKKSQTTGKINLTNRQEQVFKYIIERGSSNKVIAKSLGISESAVKLHVTEIFKKYGVKNRTQLAVFAKVPVE